MLFDEVDFEVEPSFCATEVDSEGTSDSDVPPIVVFSEDCERTELDLEGSEEQVMWSEDINFDEESGQEVIPEGT